MILHIKKPPIITRIIGAIVRACYPFYSGCGTFANSKLIGFLSMGSQNTVTWCNVSGGKVLGSLQEYKSKQMLNSPVLGSWYAGICKIQPTFSKLREVVFN